jgi:hypothetical protein
MDRMGGGHIPRRYRIILFDHVSNFHAEFGIASCLRK